MEITTELLNWALSNGPLGIVTLVAVFLGFLVWVERKKPPADPPSLGEIKGLLGEVKELVHGYEKLAGDYHEISLNIARSMERLAVLLDERTRGQNGRGRH